MSMTRAELQEAADKAFGQSDLMPDAAQSWALIAEMGWLMMAVPDDQGGLGLGLEAAGVIHRMLGKALVPGPAMTQMLAIEALARTNILPERDTLIADAMAGEVMTASLAGGTDADDRLTCVPDADIASHVLHVTAERIALVPTQHVSTQYRPGWDKSRRLFDVTLHGPGLTLAEGTEARLLAQRIEALRLFFLAGDSLGGAEAALAMTVDYLETRRQFDRPLALFQALKHRVADMRTALSASEALFWSRAADDAAALPRFGALKAHATSVYRHVAEEAIQLHGGIGLTMEHPCHLFLKRAMLNCALGGDADHWDEQAGRAALVAAA